MENIFKESGKAIMAVFKLIFGGAKTEFNTSEMRRKWQQIEKLLQNNDQLYAAQAIIRADSFLDEVMKKVGGRGETYADRLRSLEKKFDQEVYQGVWQAHKLRNQIAHEHINVTIGQAKTAITALRRGASQLGAF